MRVSKLIPWILSGVSLLSPPVARAHTSSPVRWTTVVTYCDGTGTTRLDLRGTGLLPDAHGKAEVEGKKGFVAIETEMKDMVPASVFGGEYLTYVLWAITPGGQPVNLGEVVLDSHNRGELNVMINLPAFGLIVTAEPYFAVTEPSDLVVLDNCVSPATNALAAQTVRYELLQRGHYIANLPPAELKGIGLATLQPLDLHEAQNAVRIARWANADKYAPDSFAKAECFLQQAEEFQALEPLDPDSKAVSAAARAAVQAAEDARWTAVMRESVQSVAKVIARPVSE